MITRDEIKKLKQAVGQFYWHCNFLDFCEATGFDKGTDYAHNKWKEFAKLNEALGAIDDATLLKLFAFVQKKETSNVS